MTGTDLYTCTHISGAGKGPDPFHERGGKGLGWAEGAVRSCRDLSVRLSPGVYQGPSPVQPKSHRPSAPASFIPSGEA